MLNGVGINRNIGEVLAFAVILFWGVVCARCGSLQIPMAVPLAKRLEESANIHLWSTGPRCTFLRPTKAAPTAVWGPCDARGLFPGVKTGGPDFPAGR